MPLAKPPRRRVSTSSLGEHSLSTRTSMSTTPRHHRVTKVPLAVSVTAFLAVIAVIIGTMAASSMQRDDEMLRADLARVQQDLSDRVMRLEEAMTKSSQPAPIPTPVSNSMALPVTITAKELHEMQVKVDAASWNKSTSTQVVEYRDTERGIRFTVPYNPNWGNGLYKVAPYEVVDNKILFGPLNVGAGDEFSRTYVISFETKEDPNTLLTKYRTEYKDCTPDQVKQRVLPAGNLSGTIFSFPSCLLAGPREIAVFSGKKLNYRFSTLSESPFDQKDRSVFSALILSLRSI